MNEYLFTIEKMNQYIKKVLEQKTTEKDSISEQKREILSYVETIEAIFGAMKKQNLYNELGANGK